MLGAGPIGCRFETMTHGDQPPTAATRLLDRFGVPYRVHRYAYRERGGAGHAAKCLGVPPRQVIKTLVMQTDDRRLLLVLMHGDLQVSGKRLARITGARRVGACAPQTALRATGYQVGGISPFGVRTLLPVYAERSIFDLPHVFINGGRRGLLLELAPDAIRAMLSPTVVSVAIQ